MGHRRQGHAIPPDGEVEKNRARSLIGQSTRLIIGETAGSIPAAPTHNPDDGSNPSGSISDAVISSILDPASMLNRAVWSSKTVNRVQIWPESNSKFADFRDKYYTDGQWHQLLGKPPFRDFLPEGKYREDIAHAIVFGADHPGMPVTIASSVAGFTAIAMDQRDLEAMIDMIMVMKR
jgi:hypothetical protein